MQFDVFRSKCCSLKTVKSLLALAPCHAEKRVKLSFSGEDDDANGRAEGRAEAAGGTQTQSDAAEPDSVLQKRQFRGQRIETPSYTGELKFQPWPVDQ